MPGVVFHTNEVIGSDIGVLPRAPGTDSAPLLLLVTLDGVLVTHLGLVGIHPEVGQRPSLIEEIPALVELELDLLETVPVGVVQRGLVMKPPESMLFVYQLSDAGEELGICCHARRSPLHHSQTLTHS